MKQCINAGRWSLITSFVLHLFFSSAEAAQRPNYPLDMTPREYASLRQTLNLQGIAKGSPLKEIIQMGEVNLTWIELINSQRDANHKILLSDKNSLKGIPIESPKIYSDVILLSEFRQWFATVDGLTQKVLKGEVAISANPTLGDADFQILVRKMNKFYDTSTRWITYEPYLDQLEYEQAYDVRGYYFLSRRADRSEFLKNFSRASKGEQNQIREWLIQMCRNDDNNTLTACQNELEREIFLNHDLNEFYSTKLSAAQNNWEHFFDFYHVRNDMTFKPSGSIEEFKIPFLDPKNAKVASFIKDNTEDEWKMPGWQLLVDYQLSGPQAKVDFQKGVVPHVSGGNTIVMDANQFLDDWETEWTIRHEFGHILGFIDCYVEFYDSSIKAIVSYQLDTTNLMCSRGGKIKPIHYEKLKKYYGF